jgi:hypothetical protein
MRIEHRFLTSSGNNRNIKKAISILDRFAIKYVYKKDLESIITSFKYNLEVKLYEDEEHTDELIRKLKSFDFLHQVGTVYEKVDITNADWFWITSGEHQYPQPEDDFGYLNVTFNLDNYCSTCGIGKTQNNPFRLKTIPKQPKNQFWGLHWEHDSIFVRLVAKKIIESERIKGVEFKNVVLHKKNLNIGDFDQLIINTELEKGLITGNLKTVTCKYMNEEDITLSEGCRNSKDSNFCSRLKHNFPIRGGLTFNKSVFNGVPEIVKSNEWFGSGANAFKLILVSKRMKELFESNKLKGLKFTPIFH